MADDETRKLLSDVVHDLRSPLGAIHLQAGVLKRSLEPGSPLEPRAEAILRNAARLEAMLHDLSDVVDLERGLYPISLRPVDAGASIRALADGAGLAPDDRVLHLDFPGGLEVLADQDAFRRVLEILVRSAGESAPEGTTIVIKAAPVPGGIQVCVADHGPPVEADERAAAFEPFHRFRSRPSEGIGLYAAALFVHAQGGLIDAESDPGGETRFSFTLPTP